MIHHIKNKNPKNPIHIEIQRVDNVLLIKEQFKNAHLAEIARQVFLNAHKKRKWNITMEVAYSPEKERPTRKIRESPRIERIMRIPVRVEEED